MTTVQKTFSKYYEIISKDVDTSSNVIDMNNEQLVCYLSNLEINKNYHSDFLQFIYTIVVNKYEGLWLYEKLYGEPHNQGN